MTLYVQPIGNFTTNANKINNLDNENTYIIQDTLEITGNFWGLRQLKNKTVNGITTRVINPRYRDLYNNLTLNSYILLGDKPSGFNLYKIRAKFINTTQNLFDDVFYYCFQLQKINSLIKPCVRFGLLTVDITDKDLLVFIGRTSFSRQSITNFTTLYNKTGANLIDFINQPEYCLV